MSYTPTPEHLKAWVKTEQAYKDLIADPENMRDAWLCYGRIGSCRLCLSPMLPGDKVPDCYQCILGPKYWGCVYKTDTVAHLRNAILSHDINPDRIRKAAENRLNYIQLKVKERLA